MKIQTKYICFVVVVHAAALVLSFFVFQERKWLFLVAEIIILFSVLLSWQIYRELIKPLQLLVQGADAIESRDFNIKFVQTGTPEMDKLIGVYNLMIDQLRDERTRQEEQHYFLEKLIQTSPTGILILDFDGKIHQVNPMALGLLGYEEADVKGKMIEAIDHPIMVKVQQLAPGTSGTINNGATATFKIHKAHFIDHGFPRHFILIEVLTTEILEAEKNAYGKVIRMMAHEVNNTIGPVNSIMESAAKRFVNDPESASIFEAVQIAINRNNNLNHFMRNFADLVRIPSPSKTLINLNEVLLNTSKLMENRSTGKSISFKYLLSDNPFMISADQQQLEQVFINVLKNAMEAIDHTGEIVVASDSARRRIVISDNGKGISLELSSQLFKPFFSTKKDGQGIGLTLIREVLFNHGFDFSLKTIKPGKTEFAVEFKN
ncbi:MAG: ATP-binding protein [Flavitalea sp.]